MPTWGYGSRVIKQFCHRRITWSISRGGCPFTPGHTGSCKPGRRRR